MNTGGRARTRRAMLRALAAAPVGAALGACASTDDVTEHRLVTSEPGGFFHEFGNLLAQAVRDADVPMVLRPLATTGFFENYELLQAGRAELAMALVDSLIPRKTGALAVGKVYENYLQAVVPESSRVRRVADLRGRRVSLGYTSGTEFTACRVLAAAGLTTADVVPAPIPVVDVLDALTDGTIEAAFVLGGVPHPSVDPSGRSDLPGGVRLLDLADVLPRLRVQHGDVYQPVTLRPGLYGTRAPVTTTGVASLLVAHPRLSDDAVAAVVDVLRDRSDVLVPTGALGAQYLDARSLVHTFGVPLHPGAVRAYRHGHG